LIIGTNSVQARGECENNIEIDGNVITVTVCDRKTSFWDAVFGFSCGTDASSSCSFTNIQ